MDKMSETKIREAKNLANVKGKLVKKHVKEIPSKNGGISLIVDLEVEVSENNVVPVNFFVSEKKKNGEENGLFKGVKTIADEYEEGDIVVIESDVKFASGSLVLNEFYTESGTYVGRPQIKAISAHRERKGEEEIPFKAECQIEGYITYIDKEIENEEETGSLIIKIVSPAFAGRLGVFDLKVDNPDFIPAVEKLYSEGDTVEFIVQFKNEVIVDIVETEMAIGEDYKQAVTSYDNGLIVTQAGYPRTDGLEYTEEQINKAMAERDNFLAEMKKKAMEPKKKDSAGGAFGQEAGAKSNALGIEDDIPF